MVRRTKGEDVGRWEKEVRDLSLYKFWWKYCVFDRKFWGGSVFEHPLPHAGAEASDLDRYLGVRDLYEKFEGRIGWGMAMMEMLVDPMLLTWVPAWVVEQVRACQPLLSGCSQADGREET